MSGSGNLPQPLISPTFAFVDPKTGIPTPQGLRFLLTLQQRTGGSTGVDIATIAALAEGALQKDENLFDVPNKTTARSNLGLGSAATQDSSAFATAGQGALAGSALQPNTDIPVATVQVNGDQVVGPRETGWTASIGAESRVGLDGDWTQAISNPPTQVEVEAVVAQLSLVTQTLVALLDDGATFGWIGL